MAPILARVGAGPGIDTAAHHAAIAAGARTLAVHAGGLDTPFPPGNHNLHQQITTGHLLVSEVGPGVRPTRSMFTARGRLLAALGEATIVVESGPRGTALTTATWSNHLDKPTMAVPRPVTSAMSAGCHNLIRNHHAELVTSPDQVAAVLEQPPATPSQDASQAATQAPLNRRQIMETFRHYNSAGFGTFDQAFKAAGRITQAGLIGAVHSVRTYDPTSIVDGEIEYLTQAHETIVFEDHAELDQWADTNGLRVVEGRSNHDILTSINPYQHPHNGLIETHDLYIQHPHLSAQTALQDQETEHRAVQATLLAALPTTTHTPNRPPTPTRQIGGSGRGAVPDCSRPVSPDPPAEPDVRLSPHPALHVLMPMSGCYADLCRRRHKSAYAATGVMPTCGALWLVRVGSGVVNAA
ncbi:MAG: hypothetical protein GX454_08070 [Brooklawnia sp.]|nr:hypothetical protein [Brooklawnia sp.]